MIGGEARGLDLGGAAGTGLHAGNLGFGVVIEIAVEGMSND